MPSPVGSLVVTKSRTTGLPFYEAKWRAEGRQVKRRVGPAWLEADGDGWKPRRGRIRDDFFDERRATVRMAQLIEEHATGAAAARRERERPATFREVAHHWLQWLAEVRKAKDSTLTDHRSLLAEPNQTYRRGRGSTRGRIMATFGDRRAGAITRREVSDFLRELDQAGLSARSVNKQRATLSAIFNYAMREDTFALDANPVAGTDKRREPPAAALDFFEPDEIELLAQAAADGAHRSPPNGRGPDLMALTDDEIDLRCTEDAQDAEMIRVLAYTGLRLGEALALKWGDVDADRSRLIVQRAVSGSTEGPTKSWQVRYVPLASPALAALERLRAREDFTRRADYVLAGRTGRRLDGSAFRRRYHAARRAAGLRYIKLHGLRHGAGSLIARETDAVFVQHFLGHARLATTERYMHAKARHEDIEKLNRAFGAIAAPHSAT